MSSDRESALANSEAYRAARDVVAHQVLAGRLPLDPLDIAEWIARKFGLEHDAAHAVADQFLLDVKTDRRVHDQHAD